MSFLRYFTVVLGALASTAGAAELNLQPPVTSIARDVYDLHTLLLIITGAIAVVVFGVMFYAIIRHRKAAGRTAKLFHENTAVEIIWTVIPFLILVGMAWPATRTVLAQKSTRGEDMTIKVTGYQWKWRYDYLDDNFGFVSHLATPQTAIQGAAANPGNYLLEVDEPLVVPTGKKVRLLLTANDVIHSWWMPAFGVKQDAIPGFVRDSWFKVDTPGTYRGQCSELCGKDHAFMPITIRVVNDNEFKTWVEAAKKKYAVDQVAPPTAIAAVAASAR
jgi:cytochrome c oxidase subunit 2